VARQASEATASGIRTRRTGEGYRSQTWTLCAFSAR
jgi:hypothetical protein